MTQGGTTEYRHQIPLSASASAIVTRSSQYVSTTYVTKDHLGSGTLVMTDLGAVLLNLSFGSFGERRGSAWHDEPTQGQMGLIEATTRRGFTGHEHLDSVNLIHMNGRVYDPWLGQFLSADPVDGNVYLSQRLARYSYVMNSPHGYTDPTGFNESGDVCIGKSGGNSPNNCLQEIDDVRQKATAAMEEIIVKGQRLQPMALGVAGVSSFAVSGATFWSGAISSFLGWSRTANAASGQGEQRTHYIVREFSFCSAESFFDAFRQPGGSAPGAPYAEEGTTSGVELYGGNPITQMVDVEALTITNVTEEGHTFIRGGWKFAFALTRWGRALPLRAVEVRSVGDRT